MAAFNVRIRSFLLLAALLQRECSAVLGAAGQPMACALERAANLLEHRCWHGGLAQQRLAGRKALGPRQGQHVLRGIV